MNSDHIHWFRSAAPYINKHTDQVLVVHLSGTVIASERFTFLIHDLALLNSLGIKIVLVFGARPQIDRRLAMSGHSSSYVNNNRITDAAALSCIKEVVGALRLELEARLSMGAANSPMAGARLRVVSGNYVAARPVGVRNGVDHQYTGEVRRVDTGSLIRSLADQCIVLLSPLGFSPTGEVFNIKSEDVATATAVALGAAKLILISHGTGASTSRDEVGAQLTLSDARGLIDERRRKSANTERGGDDPLTRQLDAAVHACNNGVTRAHLLDHRIDGALLLELFTRDGVGTMVSADDYDSKRQATIDDVAGILKLIEPLELEGVLVRRSRDKLEREIDRFTVMERDGAIIACAALYRFANTQAMELACLAVHPHYRQSERGDILLADLEKTAKEAGATTLFVLTTRTAQWFIERGFEPSDIDSLPVERKTLYNYQRRSRVLSKTL
ncbi:MAG: amino-acid N-acetyltransferase [Gammaproteobacteria bacterium]|nr:amino-acid N-acetyltransferase [Gammaproteobacteria bacterium]